MKRGVKIDLMLCFLKGLKRRYLKCFAGSIIFLEIIEIRRWRAVLKTAGMPGVFHQKIKEIKCPK